MTDMTRNRPVDFLVWIFFILVLICARDCSNSYSIPKDIFVKCEQAPTEEPTFVYFSLNEPLRFLGLLPNNRVWVENESGQRGISSYYENSLEIISEHTEEDLKEYQLNTRSYYYTSLKHAEEYCIGHQMTDIESKWRPATSIIPRIDGKAGWQATFTTIAALDDDGNFYNIITLHDSDGTCTNVFKGNKLRKGNNWALKKLPLTTTIAGWDWVMWNVEDDLYKSDHGSWAWYWRWSYNIIAFVFIYLLWAIFPAFIPLFAMTGCLEFDFMRRVSTGASVFIGLLLSIGLGYIWMVAILCWGYYWFLYIPIFIIGCSLAAMLIYGLLDDTYATVPLRCPKCGRTDSYQLVRSVKVKKYKEVLLNHQKIGTQYYEDDRSRHTKTYTYEVYFNGKFDGIQKYDITTYNQYAICEYRDWEIHYDVTESDNTYRCKCGEVRLVKGVKNKVETGRQAKGTHKERVNVTGGERTYGKLPEDSSYYKYYLKSISE